MSNCDEGVRWAQIAIGCLVSYKNSDIRLVNVNMNPKGETTATVLGLMELSSEMMQQAWSATNGRVRFNIGRSAYDGSAMQCTLCATGSASDGVDCSRSMRSKIVESALLLTGFVLFHGYWRAQVIQ